MKPVELQPSSFSRYPPEAAKVATSYVELMRRLPLAVLPSILEQVMAYDWKFPSEREQLSGQLTALQALDADAYRKAVAAFGRISIPTPLTKFDWVNQPGRFVELLTSHLWSSRQIDSYRAAAKLLLDSASVTKPGAESYQSRIIIFVTAAEIASASYPLFSKLRPHGLHCSNVNGEPELMWPFEILTANAAKTPGPYRHWYLDEDKERPLASGKDRITTLSYSVLNPVRKAVLSNMDRAIRSGDGPELLHSRLSRMQPAECGAPAVTTNPILQRFVTELFTQGSGTQIFSTSFVQWTAREILRRSQPYTLVIRATPRVKQRSLNELIAQQRSEADLDPDGSLVDSDLAAYYAWLELQKLPGADRSVFLAWFVGRGEAFLSGPTVPKNVTSATRMNIREVFRLAAY